MPAEITTKPAKLRELTTLKTRIKYGDLKETNVFRVYETEKGTYLELSREEYLGRVNQQIIDSQRDLEYPTFVLKGKELETTTDTLPE